MINNVIKPFKDRINLPLFFMLLFASFVLFTTGCSEKNVDMTVDNTPKVVDSERRQAFKWLKPDELPLDEFHTADVDFINTKLGKYCVSDA